MTLKLKISRPTIETVLLNDQIFVGRYCIVREMWQQYMPLVLSLHATCGNVTWRQDFRGKGSSCQYIDTSRKAVDCATTSLLTVFIQWNFAAGFSSCIAEIVQKTTNLGNLSPFWGSYGRRRNLVDGSLESPCTTSIRHNWTFFASSYRWGATSQNVSRLTAIRRW